MSRISLVSGSLKPRREPTPEQLQTFVEVAESISIPGIDMDSAKAGVFKVSRYFLANAEGIDASSGDFVKKIALLAKEVAGSGLELKGELRIITEAFRDEPAIQHISVLGTHVVKTAGRISWTGTSKQVHA